MPTFLPVQAITRSQRVRIAGQLITPNKISFIDIGLVDPATISTITQGATKTGKLEESKYYAYVVTAVDANGGETEAGAIKAEKTVAETEPSLTVKWTKVPHAAKYKVYATPVAGAASEATALTETLKLIGETTALELKDEGTGTTARSSTVEAPAVNTSSYNVGGYAWSTHKELQNHFAIGALQQLGGYTRCNLRFAPTNATGFELKIESAKLKVAKTIVRDRNTGAFRAETAEFTSGTIESTGSTKTKLVAVVYNAAANRVETLATVEKTVESKNVTNANVLEATEKITKEQQLLYVVAFGGTGGKVGLNVTSLLTGYQTPTLADGVDLPVVAQI